MQPGCYTEPHPNHRPPKSLKFGSRPGSTLFNTDFYAERLIMLGWKLLEQGRPRTGFAYDIRPRLWERVHPKKKYSLLMLEEERDYQKFGEPEHREFILRKERTLEERRLEGVTWADWDQQGRLLFARAGQLFADNSPDFNQPVMLADFNPDVPEISEPEPAKGRKTSRN